MKIIEDRRALHRIPELGLCLPETMAYLRRSLQALSCRVFSPAEHSLCAWFDFGADRAIAFRADCDALPIAEQSRVDFSSTHPGQMHACGHDGHMAILLELARRLDTKTALPHNVLLIFQAGEEHPGGALDICRSGVLETYHVTSIFGLHLWPGLAKGVIHSRKNELMAHASEVTVDISGKSCHLAKAGDGIDAMAAAVELHRQVAQAERDFPDSIYRVLKFGRMTSGTARNAIAAQAHLEGSLRAFQDDVFDCLRDRLYASAEKVRQQFGCQIEITMSEGYPAVMNPPDLYEQVRAVVPFRELAEPTMTAEDFSWYQRFVPGMFFFLGLGDSPALHTADFCFDESILVKGADFFETLAEKLP
ncbi:MAG: amidohydrolase [Faecousia sp.]